MGDPGSPSIILNNIWALSGAALGGGVGWLLGAVVGWRTAGIGSHSSRVGSWLTRTLALGFVVAGVLVVHLVPTGPLDLVSYHATPLRALVIVDTGLAVGTSIALSLKSALHPGIVKSGAAVGVVLMIGAASIFASLPPPGEAWLEQWLKTRQEPLGAAANLITPAPIACPASSPDIAPSDERTFSNGIPGPPVVYHWINPFAPRWLPDGFGLALDRSSPHPTPHGVWTDITCREVVLVVVSRPTRHTKWPMTHGDVGGWSLVPPTWCSDESLACRGYEARGTIRGTEVPVLLELRTVGLEPGEADRIARSIPTREVAYL